MPTYIGFTIENLEPLRIANIYSSQIRQIDTLRYIPGSSIRGLIVNKLLKQLPDFESEKKVILSNCIKFMNAYPIVNNIELFPSPKGFYEDKKELGDIVSILKGDNISGKKRAKLGLFSFINDNKIHFMTNELGETLNINVDDNNIYRMQYMQKGQAFKGYIELNEESLKFKDNIINALNSENIRLGSDKTSGYGKCKIENISVVNVLPFAKYSIEKEIHNDSSIYMLLLSNTAMVNKLGENCGIDRSFLEKELGVEELQLNICSTSVVEVSGVNRTWGMRTPSVNMYEAGSVFKLDYKGHISIEKLKRLEYEGIGVKRSEGCGRVLFIKDYDKIDAKKTIEKVQNKTDSDKKPINLNKDEQNSLKIAAKGIYLNRLERKMEKYLVEEKNNIAHLKQSASDSQIGLILAECQKYKYTPNQAEIEFEKLFKHIETDKKSIVSIKYNGLIKLVRDTLHWDITSALSLSGNLCGFKIGRDSDVINAGILSIDEIIILKLQIIEKRIKIYLRGGK